MAKSQDLRSKRLPAAPLHRLIRRLAAQYGGMKELGKVIAANRDITVKGGERELHKIMGRQDVAFFAADRICTALNTHIGELWGFDVYSADLEDVG